EQIVARMPHNLRTLEQLLSANKRDFRVIISRTPAREERLAARARFLSRRRKALTLVEELSLRTRRVQPMIKQLEETSRRMDALKQRIAALDGDSSAKDEYANLRKELRDLMLMTQESPAALGRRCEKMRAQYQDYEHAK